jgi:hypothetical protein
LTDQQLLIGWYHGQRCLAPPLLTLPFLCLAKVRKDCQENDRIPQDGRVYDRTDALADGKSPQSTERTRTPTKSPRNRQNGHARGRKVREIDRTDAPADGKSAKSRPPTQSNAWPAARRYGLTMLIVNDGNSYSGPTTTIHVTVVASWHSGLKHIMGWRAFCMSQTGPLQGCAKLYNSMMCW